MVDHSKKTYMLVACDCGPVGSGRQIELAVAGMVAAGHRVCVVLLSSGGGLATRLQAVGAKVCVVNMKLRRTRFGNLPRGQNHSERAASGCDWMGC